MKYENDIRDIARESWSKERKLNKIETLVKEFETYNNEKSAKEWGAEIEELEGRIVNNMYPVVLLKSLFSLKDFMIKQKKEVEKNDKNNNAGKPIFLKLAANPREANKEVVKIRDDVFEKSMDKQFVFGSDRYKCKFCDTRINDKTDAKVHLVTVEKCLKSYNELF